MSRPGRWLFSGGLRAARPPLRKLALIAVVASLVVSAAPSAPVSLVPIADHQEMAPSGPAEEGPPPDGGGSEAPTASIESETAGTSATGDTVFYLDQAGTGVYRDEDGYDLDQYLSRSQSPLNFTIRISRDFGPVDAEGHPTLGNALYNKIGRLTLRVWDVDDDYTGTAYQPERNLVTVNGTYLSTPLSGGNSKWSINTLQVPLNLLRLPTATNPAGQNDFEVLIDTANTGADVWAVEVDWAEVRTSAEEVPVAMVHGYNDYQGDDFARMQDFYEAKHRPLVGRVRRPITTPQGSIRHNATLLAAHVDTLLRDTGSYNTNLLAHSKGGLEARLYAWDHPEQANRLVMLGTPNGGTALADMVCGVELAPGVPAAGGIAAVVRRVLQAIYGPCRSEDGLFQMTRPYIRDFNDEVHDSDGTFYGTIAGYGKGPFSALLEGEDDGFVTVASVEFNSEPAGKHRPLDTFPVTHTGLYQAGNPPAPRSLCALYAITCAGLRRSSGTATPASAQPEATAVESGSTAAAPEPEAPTLELGEALAEPAMVEGVSVAPGSYVDVPLHFEGSPRALVMVVGDQAGAGLTASFGGSALATSELLGAPVLAADLASPANGALRLTNSTSAAIDTAVLVSVESLRKMTLSATPTLAEPGQPVTITATLSVPDATDAPRAQVHDASGTMVADLALAPGLDGTWTASYTPAQAGSHSVVAAVEGPRPRRAFDIFTASSGGARLAGGFGEQLVDDDGNGLADALVVRPGVSVTSPGPYRLAADLVDGTGAVVASAGGRATLATGAQAMELRFEGEAIYRSGRDGPYRVVDVTLSHDDDTMDLEHQVAELGQTGAYLHTQFEHFPVEIDRDAFADRLVDANGDRVVDSLDVTGAVRVDSAGNYTVEARLVAADGTRLGTVKTVQSLVAGANRFTLAFPWQAIRTAGIDGPYTVEDLLINPHGGQSDHRPGYLVKAWTTAAYSATFPLSTACRASAYRISTPAATGGGSEPTVANRRYDPCTDESVGTPPTATDASEVALGYQGATTSAAYGDARSSAEAGEADVHLTSPSELRLALPASRSDAAAICSGGPAELSASSSAGAVTINGVRYEPLGSHHSQHLVPGVGTLHFNYQQQDDTDATPGPDKVTQRALWLDFVVTGPDIVVAESVASVRGCPDTPRPTISPRMQNTDLSRVGRYAVSAPRDPNRDTTLSLAYGDGTSETQAIPQGSGLVELTFPHAFAVPGTYRQRATIVETGASAEAATYAPPDSQILDDATSGCPGPLTCSFSVQTSAATKSGPAGTSLTARGYCKVSNYAACPSGMTVNLWQDTSPSVQNKAIEHQEFCRAEAPLSDEKIGSVTFDSAGDITSGSGTLAVRQPGSYIFCAGHIDDATEALWDNFTVT